MNARKFESLRDEAGLSVDEFAKICGVTKRTAYRWVSNDRVPTYAGLVLRLMIHYSLTVNDMAAFGRTPIGVKR